MMFIIFLGGCGTFLPVPGPKPVLRPEQPLGQRDPLTSERAEALLQALMNVGVDYRWGGGTPASGFDCSGLVVYVYEKAWGVRLPRTSMEQARFGTPVSMHAIEPGDLVFYNTMNMPYSHVGIYMGDGRFVHAPKTGAKVRVESLQSAYWQRRFSGARRIQAKAH